jgi:hypothetical protein
MVQIITKPWKNLIPRHNFKQLSTDYKTDLLTDLILQ